MLNIFIGNLAATTTEEGLRKLFEPFGQVSSVKIVTDRDSRAPRGFAFVEMSSDAAAKNAIAAINGTIVDEHSLNVNEARPKKTDSNSMGGQMRKHRQHRY